ncbi:hypothetical protein K458DRAFT_415635 [Lentithecium fluviatile CBS 122367]|uniref:Uncharacterized protein n=1 Tax=Lentithecium fluviatile CBS 122367 TaxID=1168545 RepID=A0A6G1JAX4_9PLEO|nr:hypothetical protein K458DRAFT_415635 [Lentithecium fluviatile CBS 122367]
MLTCECSPCCAGTLLFPAAVGPTAPRIRLRSTQSRQAYIIQASCSQQPYNRMLLAASLHFLHLNARLMPSLCPSRPVAPALHIL